MTPEYAITISCNDKGFGGTVNCGSVLTLEDAFKVVDFERRCKPMSTSRYQLHYTPLGLSRPNHSNAFLCLLPLKGGR